MLTDKYAMFDYTSFSHGQIKSKLWLCETLEPLLPNSPNVLILGGWYNVLGFMFLSRNNTTFKSITSVDIDPDTKEIADKITNAWTIDGIVSNKIADANTIDYKNIDVVINCSAEHFTDTGWFENIPRGTLVCIQTSNVTDPEHPWFIRQPSPDINSFLEKYHLSTTHFVGTYRIQYSNSGYDRYMLIGIK